jgi:hypothetical protein
MAGDVSHNAGIFVNAILAKPEVSLPSKYANMYTDHKTMPEALKDWSEVSGKRATMLSVTPEEIAGLFGVFGEELAAQFKLHDVEDDWERAHRPDMVHAEDLGIADGELKNHRQALEANKALL